MADYYWGLDLADRGLTRVVLGLGWLLPWLDCLHVAGVLKLARARFSDFGLGLVIAWA